MVNDPAYDADKRLDASVPHSARFWNNLLQGKDNFAADRDAAAELTEAWDGMPIVAREDRLFLRRALTLLAENGARQFLDIGTGLPQEYEHENTHETVQQVDPSACVAYVDHDPLVLAHARALLTSAPEGKTGYIDADLREPEKILQDDNLRETLDMSKPVVLVLGAILHLLADEQPYDVMRYLTRALSPGSALIISHGSLDKLDEETIARLEAKKSRWLSFVPRTEAEITRFFDGWQLLEPGVTLVSHWRRDPERDGPAPPDDKVSMYGGVALKPR